MSKEFIKCPICATIQPSEVDFCVYCNTPFDKATVEILTSDDTSDFKIENDNEK